MIPPSLSQAWSQRCNTLPHNSSSVLHQCRRVLHQPQAQEEKEGTPLEVSSKGGAPFLERDSLQVIDRAFGDSITRVFIVGPWKSDLVHSWGVLGAI
jgi:hypothetical protein